MTYGRSTEASAQGAIARGFDLPDQDRYVSVSQMTYQSQIPLRKNILKDFPFDEEPVSPKRPKHEAYKGKITLSYEQAKQAAAQN